MLHSRAQAHGSVNYSTSEILVRAGLHALRDVLRGKWNTKHDYTASIDGERPAKKARIEATHVARTEVTHARADPKP